MPSLVKIDLEKTTTTTMTTYNGQKHIITTYTLNIKTLLQDDHNLKVDCGFKDSAGVLLKLGIHIEMTFFLQKDQKQHFSKDTNISPLSTKVCINIASDFCSFKGILESILM